MFLVRALFWIMVVSIMLPRVGLSPPPADSQVACGAYTDTCRAGLSLLDRLSAVAHRRLLEVKAEHEAAEAVRHAHREI